MEERSLESSVDPIELFCLWMQDAVANEPNDANAVALATATPDGMPSVRMVLMKGVDECGFAFYTNEESQKGIELRRTRERPCAFIGSRCAARCASRGW